MYAPIFQRVWLLSLFLIFLGLSSAPAAIRDVTVYGATGNGTTDDTAAINNAIAALQSGDTLLFPAGTYKVTGQLNINVPNVKVDGSNNAATISLHASSAGLHFGSVSCISCSLGTKAALSTTANELATSLTTTASIGTTAGSYIFVDQGGKD